MTNAKTRLALICAALAVGFVVVVALREVGASERFAEEHCEHQRRGSAVELLSGITTNCDRLAQAQAQPQARQNNSNLPVALAGN